MWSFGTDLGPRVVPAAHALRGALPPPAERLHDPAHVLFVAIEELRALELEAIHQDLAARDPVAIVRTANFGIEPALDLPLPRVLDHAFVLLRREERFFLLARRVTPLRSRMQRTSLCEQLLAPGRDTLRVDRAAGLGPHRPVARVAGPIPQIDSLVRRGAEYALALDADRARAIGRAVLVRPAGDEFLHARDIGPGESVHLLDLVEQYALDLQERILGIQIEMRVGEPFARQRAQRLALAAILLPLEHEHAAADATRLPDACDQVEHEKSPRQHGILAVLHAEAVGQPAIDAPLAVPL